MYLEASDPLLSNSEPLLKHNSILPSRKGRLIKLQAIAKVNRASISLCHLWETAEILSINPPLSPNLGGFFKAGGTHPQAPGRKYLAPLSQQSL